MRALAAWLVARPLNSALALALTVSLGFMSFTSGVVLVLLVLHKGSRRALIDLGLAGVLTIVIGLIAQVPLATIIPGALGIWMPAMLFSVLVIVTRSVTLTIQLSLIIAVVAITGIFLVFGNPVDYWVSQLSMIIEALIEAKQYALANWLELQKQYAGQMTMAAVFVNWSVHTVAFVLGYKMYRLLPGVKPVFGRFRDLNLGRVIALLLAVTSVLWMLTDLQWLQSVAFVLFGAFWLQGLAIVHWLYGEKMMPRIGVVITYTMLLSFILSGITLMGLAIFGYLDAWFRLRRQPKIT